MTQLLRSKKTPVTVLAASIAVALQVAALPALAQTAASDDGLAQNSDVPAGQASELDTIRVVGYRASVERALDIKRGEAGVVDAVAFSDALPCTTSSTRAASFARDCSSSTVAASGCTEAVPVLAVVAPTSDGVACVVAFSDAAAWATLSISAADTWGTPVFSVPAMVR